MWRVNNHYGAQWRRRWRRRRKDGVLGGSSVGPCPDFLTTNAHTSEGRFSFNSFATVR